MTKSLVTSGRTSVTTWFTNGCFMWRHDTQCFVCLLWVWVFFFFWFFFYLGGGGDCWCLKTMYARGRVLYEHVSDCTCLRARKASVDTYRAFRITTNSCPWKLFIWGRLPCPELLVSGVMWWNVFYGQCMFVHSCAWLMCVCMFCTCACLWVCMCLCILARICVHVCWRVHACAFLADSLASFTCAD